MRMRQARHTRLPSTINHAATLIMRAYTHMHHIFLAMSLEPEGQLAMSEHKLAHDQG